MCFGGGLASRPPREYILVILYTLFICLLLLLFFFIIYIICMCVLYFINNTTIVREQRFESAEKCDVCFVFDLISVCVFSNIIQHNNDTTNYILSCVVGIYDTPVQVLWQESNACLRTRSHLLCPRERKRPAHTKDRICIFKHIIIGCRPRRRVRSSQQTA